MRHTGPIGWAICLLLQAIVAQNAGLTGFPDNPYDPYCAMACLRSIYTLKLSCSQGGDSVGMVQITTSSECWATNDPYLETLAWCIHLRCPARVPESKREKFWESQATGQSSAGVRAVPAKWSYAEALAASPRGPTEQLSANATKLSTVALVNPEVWQSQWNVLSEVQRQGTLGNAYGIAFLVAGLAMPILMTALGYTPYVSRLLDKLKPYLLWPSTFGTRHQRPLPWLLGYVPTRGQSLYIAMFFGLQVVLSCVGYQSRQPNAWYADTQTEISAYILARTGQFGYILLPLVFLFASRNNILLWLTDWSHSTYMLLHRWIARVFFLQAVVHSIVGLVQYKRTGMYSMEVSKPYWIWGIVATIATVILTFGSGLYIRKFAYELFLLSHIALSVIVVVGCWYHAYDLYAWLGGYYVWLIACSAVWFADRTARLVRIVMAGRCHAKVTELGEDYLRIDVPGIRWGSAAGQHVYMYFPSLNKWQPWKNNPFSVLSTALIQPADPPNNSEAHSQRSSDIEKSATVRRTSFSSSSSLLVAGLTLYIRRSKGTTRALRPHENLLTLVEGPYPNSSTTKVLRCDRLLLIGGGIGITALLPFTYNHWNVRLAWSVQESAQALVDDLEPTLRTIEHRDIRVGSRLDVRQLLSAEIVSGWEKVGVIVSGPAGLCDDARQAVIEASKLGLTKFELEIESYSW